jgi:hypothetical protein
MTEFEFDAKVLEAVPLFSGRRCFMEEHRRLKEWASFRSSPFTQSKSTRSESCRSRECARSDHSARS